MGINNNFNLDLGKLKQTVEHKVGETISGIQDATMNFNPEEFIDGLGENINNAGQAVMDTIDGIATELSKTYYEDGSYSMRGEYQLGDEKIENAVYHYYQDGSYTVEYALNDDMRYVRFNENGVRTSIEYTENGIHHNCKYNEDGTRVVEDEYMKDNKLYNKIYSDAGALLREDVSYKLNFVGEVVPIDAEIGAKVTIREITTYNEDGSSSYELYNDERCISREVTTIENGEKIKKIYDNNNLASTEYESGKQINYDENGNVNHVSLPNGESFEVENGRVTGADGVEIEYYENGNIKSIKLDQQAAENANINGEYTYHSGTGATYRGIQKDYTTEEYIVGYVSFSETGEVIGLVADGQSGHLSLNESTINNTISDGGHVIVDIEALNSYIQTLNEQCANAISE